MATKSVTPAQSAASAPQDDLAPGEHFYDRSSLAGDYMVMIAGQTVEQWRRLAPGCRICEYIDGIIYMPNSPTDEHQDVAGFLFFLLNGWRCERDMGHVRFAPWTLVLGPDRNPQPDISVLPPGEPQAPALFVIEVLSPSTKSHDLGLKRKMYQEACIPEIGFVDLEERSFLIERLTAAGGYTSERRTEGFWAPSSWPGFWIDVAWLWDGPLPNARRCLEQILAGPPA